MQSVTSFIGFSISDFTLLFRFLICLGRILSLWLLFYGHMPQFAICSEPFAFEMRYTRAILFNDLTLYTSGSQLFFTPAALKGLALISLQVELLMFYSRRLFLTRTLLAPLRIIYGTTG